MTAREDTIVAISSAPGQGARGLIRFSGPRTGELIDTLLVPDDFAPRKMTRAHLRSPASLPVWLCCFKAPQSYTAQDMAELQLPGQPALLDRVLVDAVKAGARLAEAGEFTFRAFLGGKLDLTQAEGVAATIAAQSDAQLQAATHLRQGELGAFASDLVDQLADQLALVEAGIDFVDQEDVVPITPGHLHDNLRAIKQELDALLGRSRPWSAVEALPRVVLVGAPSAGKSTLFNALLGTQRAVVSPMMGTTRDVLTESLRLNTPRGDVEVMLVDIAGLDTPDGELDAAAQSAAKGAIEQADLLLMLDDEVDTSGWSPTANQSALRVRTKADLTPEPSQSGRFELAVSAKTGLGLAELRTAIAQRLSDRAVSLSGQLLALTPRHESGLTAANQSLADAISQVAGQVTRQQAQRSLNDPELIAGCLRAALDELAALGGQMTPDDVIGRVFSRFCVGK